MSASVIAHGDSAPIFEPPEHDFDFVALFIKLFVIGDRLFSVSLGRNARRNASFEQAFAKPCGIIAPVGQ